METQKLDTQQHEEGTIDNTRSKTASYALAMLALTAAFATADCKSTPSPDKTRQSFIEIEGDQEASDALETLRQEFEDRIRQTGFSADRVRDLLVKRDCIFMAHNIPPQTERWWRKAGEGQGNTLEIDIDQHDCASSPSCVIVGTDENGQRTRRTPFAEKKRKTA